MKFGDIFCILKKFLYICSDMKKLLLKRDIPKHHIECGEFIVNFYFRKGSIKDTYMEIKTTSNVFEMRLDGRAEIYSYLFAAAEQGLTDQIHGYCLRMFEFGMLMHKDQEMLNAHDEVMRKYYENLNTQAEVEAAKVTKEQELAAEAFMRDAIERGALKGKAAKEASKAEKELIKQVLEENGTDSENEPR